MDAPQVGQVVVHHFLWSHEHEAGRIEAHKARPCLIIAVEPIPESARRVTVLPITSRKPAKTSTSVSVPDAVRRRIGLDRARSAWVVLDEANIFTWPGFDLVPQKGGGFVCGVVTRGFFGHVREAVSVAHRRGELRRIDRD
ncbi:MAG: type II toxin-antitoxin system PemK/MazF family toxin [Bauldia sp.]|nr:type II toxin-antitoxin system PemK/MazF family toxin [Bauldia sp.]